MNSPPNLTRIGSFIVGVVTTTFALAGSYFIIVNRVDALEKGRAEDRAVVQEVRTDARRSEERMRSMELTIERQTAAIEALRDEILRDRRIRGYER